MKYCIVLCVGYEMQSNEYYDNVLFQDLIRISKNKSIKDNPSEYPDKIEMKWIVPTEPGLAYKGQKLLPLDDFHQEKTFSFIRTGNFGQDKNFKLFPFPHFEYTETQLYLLNDIK